MAAGLALLALAGCSHAGADGRPPAGKVWFGRTVDSAHQSVTDRVNHAAVGEIVYYAATFPESHVVTVEVDLDDAVIFSQTFPIPNGGTTDRQTGQISGTRPGTLKVIVLAATDVVASGDLTITG